MPAIKKIYYQQQKREIVDLAEPFRSFMCISEFPTPQVWSKVGSLPLQGISLCVCHRGVCADNLKEVVNRLLIIRSSVKRPCN